MPRDPEINPGPKGSFISEDKVKEMIGGENPKTEKPPSDEEAKEPEESEEGAPENDVPERINSALGVVSYKTFKRRYKEVWDQVEDKRHLAQGFCLYSTAIAEGIDVTLRSFRTREMKVLRRLAPTANPDTDLQRYLEQDFEHRSFQIILGLVRFEGVDLPEIPLPESDIETWKKSEEVQSRLRWVDDLPEMVTELLGGVLADVTIAYRYALRENLKNQYALL